MDSHSFREIHVPQSVLRLGFWLAETSFDIPPAGLRIELPRGCSYRVSCFARGLQVDPAQYEGLKVPLDIWFASKSSAMNWLHIVDNDGQLAPVNGRVTLRGSTNGSLRERIVNGRAPWFVRAQPTDTVLVVLEDGRLN